MFIPFWDTLKKLFLAKQRVRQNRRRGYVYCIDILVTHASMRLIPCEYASNQPERLKTNYKSKS